MILVLVLMGCDNKQNAMVCDCEGRKKVGEFMDRNIKGANNMSDEEMEDVLAQLYKSAVSINCRQKQLDYSFNGHLKSKLDSCETVMPW